MQLNINTDAVVKFTNTLEKLHKSALPSAIRGTLNKAVYDVKTNTMLKSADKEFAKRQPNFFRANSKFENAIGFNVNQMKATVGFLETGLRGENNYAVKDLEEQEYSGTIAGRSFIPLRSARIGNNANALVRSNARISKIKNIINSRNSKGKNIKEKFIKAAIVAGKGGYVISGKRQVLFRVDSFLSNRKSKKTFLKATPLYKFKRHGKVKVKSTKFMQTASLVSANKLEEYYIAEANRQIEKYLK